jgi:hypothetical protein
MDLAVSLDEFLAMRCHRCGEPMPEHRVRPIHIPELPDVPAAEILCPMIVLDLGEEVRPDAVPTLRPANRASGVRGRDRPGERRAAVRGALPLRPDAAACHPAGAADRMTPLQPSPRG